MKRIVNLNEDGEVSLPGGIVLGGGRSMPVLNEAILSAREVEEMVASKRIRVEEGPGLRGGSGEFGFR